MSLYLYSSCLIISLGILSDSLGVTNFVERTLLLNLSSLDTIFFNITFLGFGSEFSLYSSTLLDPSLSAPLQFKNLSILGWFWSVFLTGLVFFSFLGGSFSFSAFFFFPFFFPAALASNASRYC